MNAVSGKAGSRQTARLVSHIKPQEGRQTTGTHQGSRTRSIH